MWIVTSFDPTTATNGTFLVAFSGGSGKLHIKNASPVDLYFSINNDQYATIVVQAGEPRSIIIPMPRVTMYWSYADQLNTNVKQLQSMVYVEGYQCFEDIPPSHPLPRHFNATSIGYSTNVTQNVSANGKWYALSLFNPATSSVDALVYSAVFSTTDTVTMAPRLTFVTTDPDLSGATAQIRNRIIGGPSSQMNATSAENLSNPITSALGFSDVMQVPAGIIFDFVQSPDEFLLPPGYGVVFQSQIASTSSVTTYFLKWTETPVLTTIT
jgi:hypothetical protein